MKCQPNAVVGSLRIEPMITLLSLVLIHVLTPFGTVACEAFQHCSVKNSIPWTFFIFELQFLTLQFSHSKASCQATPKMARTIKRFRKQEFLLNLPGEIRNQIYRQCILEALKKPKSSRSASSPGSPITEPTLKVSVLPRWTGPGHFRLEGIGKLPILFVNKQMHKEIHSLVYSMIGSLSIGGYILQFPSEDPSGRWERAYTLIRQRPDLQAFVKQVTVTLPTVRDDLFRFQWEQELGHKYPGNTVTSTPWSIIPGVIKFLRTFKSLSHLKVIATVDGPEVQYIEALEPFYDVCPLGTSIEWKSGRH
jgi:hypothetical protein